MAMIRRGATGKIESADLDQSGAIKCNYCGRYIISKDNLQDDGTCPYCHTDPNTESVESNYVEEDGEDIAESC